MGKRIGVAGHAGTSTWPLFGVSIEQILGAAPESRPAVGSVSQLIGERNPWTTESENSQPLESGVMH